MRMKKLVAAATLPAMIASPVAAANPAASLSLRGEVSESGASAAAPVGQSEAAGGGESYISTPLIIGGIAVLLIIIGAVALGHDHNDSHPASA
jgi:hypothetical protein